MASDLDIAQAAELKPIAVIARAVGLGDDDLDRTGSIREQLPHPRRKPVPRDSRADEPHRLR